MVIILFLNIIIKFIIYEINYVNELLFISFTYFKFFINNRNFTKYIFLI